MGHFSTEKGTHAEKTRIPSVYASALRYLQAFRLVERIERRIRIPTITAESRQSGRACRLRITDNKPFWLHAFLLQILSNFLGYFRNVREFIRQSIGKIGIAVIFHLPNAVFFYHRKVYGVKRCFRLVREKATGVCLILYG